MGVPRAPSLGPSSLLYASGAWRLSSPAHSREFLLLEEGGALQGVLGRHRWISSAEDNEFLEVSAAVEMEYKGDYNSNSTDSFGVNEKENARFAANMH